MESIIITFTIICSLIFQGVSGSLPKICNTNKEETDLSECNPGEVCTEEGLCYPNNNTGTLGGTITPSICLDGQTFDKLLKRCVSLIGENCITHEDCIVSATCHPEWDSTTHRFQGKCRCATGNFFENVTSRTCEERAKFGEFCDDELHPCESTSHFLSCQQGTCQCLDNKTQLYDPIKQSCVLKLGQNCYDYRRHMKSVCVQNAECVFFFSRRNIPRCKCVKGYIPTGDGFCRGALGSRCNATSLCHDDGSLVCSDGICQCDSPLTQIFDNVLKRCLNIVEAPCQLSSEISIPGQIGADTDNIHTTECVRHALCKGNLCQCEFGYSKTSRGTCELDYGQKCGWDHHEQHVSSRLCNLDAGLACKEGICKCFDSENLVFDTETKVCRLKVDSDSKRKHSVCGYAATGGVTGDEQNRAGGRLKYEGGVGGGSSGSWKYPVRCPKGYECIFESNHLGCSCDIRVHPHHNVHQEFCLRNYL